MRQKPSASLRMDITGPAAQPDLTDRLTSQQPIALGGSLLVRFASATLTPGQHWTLLSAPSITGAFASVSATGVPAGSALIISNTGTAVQALLVKSETFAQWVARNALAAPNNTVSADPDRDGIRNDLEYVLGLNPRQAEAVPPITGGVIELAGVRYLSISARMNNLCQSNQGLPLATRAAGLSGFSAAGVVLQSDILDNNSQIRTRTWRSTVPIAGGPREFLRVEAPTLP